jgi:hypothetical protein
MAGVTFAIVIRGETAPSIPNFVLACIGRASRNIAIRVPLLGDIDCACGKNEQHSGNGYKLLHDHEMKSQVQSFRLPTA